MGRPAPDLRVPAVAAARIAAALSPLRPEDGDRLQEHLDALTLEAEPLLAQETGFEAPTPAAARVLERGEWAEENIDSMLTLMGPLLRRLEARMDGRVGSLVKLGYRPALGLQLGGVLGLLSHRVLGQYDLLSEDADEVWYVGVNLMSLERRLGFEPRDFRLWVVLHELTHRLQFAANPWLRDHFLDSARGFLDEMRLDSTSLWKQAVQALREPGGDEPLAIRALGGDVKERFEEIQALMTLIEGHATFVMNRVGGRVIPTLDRIQRTLKGARERVHPLFRFLYRLLGLEMKRRQYEEGERFVGEIDRRMGADAPRLCFASAANLPTMAEIRSPEMWVERVAA